MKVLNNFFFPEGNISRHVVVILASSTLVLVSLRPFPFCAHVNHLHWWTIALPRYLDVCFEPKKPLRKWIIERMSGKLTGVRDEEMLPREVDMNKGREKGKLNFCQVFIVPHLIVRSSRPEPCLIHLFSLVTHFSEACSNKVGWVMHFEGKSEKFQLRSCLSYFENVGK